MDGNLTKCNSSYIPTSEQYFAALGSFSSTIIIIGGLVTLGLFILFFEQVIYTNQTAHHGAKRHIYWITSVFPVMTMMSLVALVIPRAHNVCQSVKMVYMSIGISHFTDLTMVMFGGEELLVERGRDDTFSLRQSPLCCCCRCLPRPPVTKYSLRLLVLLTDQLPFAQAAYYVTVSVLLSASNITLGDVNVSGAFLWLNLFRFASVMLGVYGFMILSSFSRGYLDDFEYRKKSRSIRLLLLITNFQSVIWSIMAYYGAFPCIPPYVSTNVYQQIVDNSTYLLEMMILGPYTFWQYHDQRFSTAITSLPFFSRSRSVSHSTKDDHSTTDTVTTIAEHSDTSDDEHSRGRSNSTGEISAIIDMEPAGESATATQVNSRDSSIKRSRSRSSKNSSSTEDSAIASIKDSAIASIKDSARNTSRKRRKSNSDTSRKSSEKKSANKTRNSSKEDNAVSRTSKHKNARSSPDTSQNGDSTSSSSSSKDSAKETSASPSSTNSATPAHSTSAKIPSLLERARKLASSNTKTKAEYVKFQEEKDSC